MVAPSLSKEVSSLWGSVSSSVPQEQSGQLGRGQGMDVQRPLSGRREIAEFESLHLLFLWSPGEAWRGEAT